MVLIKGLRATSFFKAFLLNSFAAALIILIALLIKGRFDTYTDEKGQKITHSTNFLSVFLTFTITFIASFGAYWFLYFVFGYGGGLLVNE